MLAKSVAGPGGFEPPFSGYLPLFCVRRLAHPSLRGIRRLNPDWATGPHPTLKTEQKITLVPFGSLFAFTKRI
jgi:hypothetical protein